VDVTRRGPIVPRSSPARQDEGVDRERSLLVHLSDFAWEALDEESTRLGVSIEELVGFSVLYYIADADSGRIARRADAIPR
jgi:hypothetical protein